MCREHHARVHVCGKGLGRGQAGMRDGVVRVARELRPGFEVLLQEIGHAHISDITIGGLVKVDRDMRADT